ncbi:ribonuclease 3-like isoform X2 [Dioscorea cayenensis subsp. rotundata]|uniref:Ribonuclease 3-like isoform X2 n=1 Tax=Dioscorea cayennensis subsp. rotundata TaxID=55577 RepID=A0AB40BC51_DIOCR|nr:ribonuclease 3-like isoform X2 [Dioscorea cayenensis subsp. rotundata]
MKQTMAAKSRSKTISLLALFIGILCLYFPVTTTAVVAESGAAVDLLYLTLVWPGTLCRTGKCCMPTKGKPAIDFLIEDLKTMDQYGQIIQNSKPKCSFSINQMPSLIPDLYSNWCNLSCPCNNGFANWNNTWCAYGQCSQLNQTDYFIAAFNMTAKANLLNAFQVNNIVPSASTSYKLRDINTALMANPGLSTHIECVTVTDGASERTLLSKINICISADGLSFINCPFDIESTCNRELFFYPFNINQLNTDCDYNYVGSSGFIKMANEKHLAM